MYQFLGHCDLDLVSRIIVAGENRMNYLREKSQIWCMDASLDADMSHTILGHCDLDLLPSFYNNRDWSIPPVLFDVGIRNLVYGLIFGWRSGPY